MIAKNNLLNTEGVGIVERYNESITLFNNILKTHGISGKIKRYKENRSKQNVDTIAYIEKQLGADLFKQIKELNALDFRLYDFANILLDKKSNQ